MIDETTDAAAIEAGTTTANELNEADLRELAVLADANPEADLEQLIAEKSAKKKSETPAKDAPAGATKKEGEPQPEAGKKPDTAKTEDAEKDKLKKSEYELSKERKKAADDERFDRNWKKLNDEKEQLRKEREAIEAEKANRVTPPAKTEPAKCERGYTAADYEATAKGLEADGEVGPARAARRKAEELKAKDAQAEKSAAPAPVARDYDAAAEGRELMTEDPSLQKADNPVVIQANALMADPKFGSFFKQKGGVRAAVEVAKLRIAAAGAAPLREENARLKAEVEELRKAVDTGASPGAPRRTAAGGKKELSEAELYALAEEADRNA